MTKEEKKALKKKSKELYHPKPYLSPFLAFKTTRFRYSPIKKIKYIFEGFKVAYHRAKYGWAYIDWFNLDSWFLTVFPQMIKHWQCNACGYREIYLDENGVEHKCDERGWNDFLLQVASDIEKLKEDRDLPYLNNFDSFQDYLDFQKKIQEDTVRVFKVIAYNLDAFWD